MLANGAVLNDPQNVKNLQMETFFVYYYFDTSFETVEYFTTIAFETEI